jgi:hypothetical protein
MTLTGSSKNYQDYPTTRENPHRIIPRTRDDPPESSKTCQGLFNNQG